MRIPTLETDYCRARVEYLEREIAHLRKREAARDNALRELAKTNAALEAALNAWRDRLRELEAASQKGGNLSEK